jgi:hypothetical protein
VTMEQEKLVQLHERLQAERRRILGNSTAIAESESLPAGLIRELADIEGAARAVAAEIARHSPKVGYGGET